MKAICKVLNIGQPVLLTVTLLSFEKWHEGSVISAKMIVKKTVIYTAVQKFVVCTISKMFKEIPLFSPRLQLFDQK